MKLEVANPVEAMFSRPARSPDKTDGRVVNGTFVHRFDPGIEKYS